MSQPQQIEPLVDEEADAALLEVIDALPARVEPVVLDTGVVREIGVHTRYMLENLDFLRNTTRQLLKSISQLRGGRPSELLQRMDPRSVDFLEQEVSQVVDECVEGLARVEEILRSGTNARDDAEVRAVR